MGRSVLAVLAGYAVLAVGIGVVDFLISRVAPDQYPSSTNPAPKWLIVELVAGLLLILWGGYVTASIARRSQIRHAMALGVLTSVLALVSLGLYHGRQPFWFQGVILVAAIPTALAGGRLKTRN